MTSGWLILLAVVGALLVIGGFLMRMGYEFRHVKSLLSRARYISVYNYQISLENGIWRLSHRSATIEVLVTSSTPRFVSLFPLAIRVDNFSVVIRDGSTANKTFDYSNYIFSPFRFPKWLESLASPLSRLLQPSVSVPIASMEYSYKGPSGGFTSVQLSLENSHVSLRRFVLTTRASSFGLVSEDETRSSQREIVSVRITGETTCEMKNLSEIATSVDSVDCHCVLADSALIEQMFQPSMHTVPSQSRLKFTLAIKSRLSTSLALQDKNCSVTSIFDMAHSSHRQNGSGLFASLIMDPFSLQTFGVSVHNVSSSSRMAGTGIRQINLQALIHNVHAVTVNLYNSSLIGDVSEAGSWTLTSRTQSVSVAFFDQSDSDSAISLKNVQLMGSERKGLSVLMSQLDLDVSCRTVSKALRVYLKVLSLVSSSPDLIPTPATSVTPHMSPLFVADPNFVLLQQRYLSSSPPPTPGLSDVSMTRTVSTQSVFSDSAPTRNSTAKNWRASERIMFDSGKALVNVTIDKVDIHNKDSLKLVLTKFKGAAKTSSIGSPFSTVCFESLALNDNVNMTGGLRIWIDGRLSSEQAKVFCLIPPVSIRFETKFAAAVEAYFLELAEVLKMLNNRGPVVATATTKKFIEFLQISSMQLELHAKEMLGVLALDKAMINLTRSSVYKSNGVIDAMDSLVSQYRQEVVGQWLSLLTRLDVSIGRPVSTARKLISGITELFNRDETPAAGM